MRSLILAAVTLLTPATLAGAPTRSLADLSAKYHTLPPAAQTEAAPLMRQLDAELAFRKDVVNPMCQAEIAKRSAQMLLANEKENPSGVVNLRLIHDAGAQLLASDKFLKASAPAYIKVRRHAWTPEKEGECNP